MPTEGKHAHRRSGTLPDWVTSHFLMQEVFDPMVTINGSPTPADGQTLAAYLTQAGTTPPGWRWSGTGDIVPKAQYSATTLADGDVVEIVRFVGGG